MFQSKISFLKKTNYILYILPEKLILRYKEYGSLPDFNVHYSAR